jgi:uncharacterized LabA/DUF88 family protein
MNPEKKTESMAVLVDIENLIVGVGRLGLPIDIGKVVTKLREEYSDLSIRIRRAYGDIYAAVKMLQRHVGEENTKGLHAAIRGNLGENLVQIADTPYLKSKNSADMWLAVDALSIAHTMPGIQRFAIVSSDRDYIPLILKLRELGREVIGFGIRSGEVNPLYVKACDSFYYYSAMFAVKEADEHKVIAAMPAAEPEDTESVRETYVKLMVEATRIINQQGKPANGGRLVPMMKQMRPDYDPALAGIISSRDLAKLAEQRGLVRCRPAGMDFEVMLVEDGGGSKEHGPLRLEPQPPPLDATNIDACVGAYREFFRDKLAVEEFPDAHVRAEIFGTTDVVLDRLGPIHLDDLSRRAAEEIQTDYAPQKTIFKLLYGLYRGGAFSYDPSAARSTYNPFITGRVIDKSSWDECFVKNCLRVLSKDKPDWPIGEIALAEVLGVATEQIKDALGNLWG